jgi:hypothetical protein
MNKWVDVPLRDLEDVLDWHARQLELAQSLQRTREHHPSAKTMPKMMARLLKQDQKRIDFHSQIVGILQQSLDKVAELKTENERLEKQAWDLGAQRT